MDALNVDQAARRRWLALLPLCFCGTGCTTGAAPVDQQRRFRGIALVLVVDAVPGVEMEGVTFRDERGSLIFASAVVAKRNRGIMATGASHVPEAVRVVWRKDAMLDYGFGAWYGGTILGDHTVPVAARIPDEVLRDIRARPGSLRLKFRLKPDGVLFGWDIERDGGGVSRFDSPGGDFLETRY